MEIRSLVVCGLVAVSAPVMTQRDFSKVEIRNTEVPAGQFFEIWDRQVEPSPPDSLPVVTSGSFR